MKRFRQLGSKTPGHPEFHDTPGVECTTGPLGQGVGNAVGLALSGRMAAARYNTPAHKIFSHKVVVLAGDGCLQEGVASEAAAFAGHQHLEELILIYDNNAVTLDAMASASQSEDTAKRFEAYGFEVHQVDGRDMAAFLAVFEKARNNTSGKPQFIMAKTIIGEGIPEVAGTQKAHGEGGAKFIDAAREGTRAAGGPAFFRERRGEGVFRRAEKGTPGGAHAVEKTVCRVEGRESGARRRAGGQHGTLRRRTAREDSRVSRRHENRHAQGGQRRASAHCRGASQGDRRQRGSLRLHAQLHQRRGRFDAGLARRAATSASASASTACAPS